MDSRISQLVVTAEEHESPSVHASYVHHREFPEIRGEGESPRIAATRLAEHLVLSLEHAPSAWRRECILRAIEDVRAYIATGD